MLERTVTTIIGTTLIAALGLAGCQKGPLQKAGEKVDQATGQDRLIGPGPAEKTGRKTDNTIDDIKK